MHEARKTALGIQKFRDSWKRLPLTSRRDAGTVSTKAEAASRLAGEKSQAFDVVGVEVFSQLRWWFRLNTLQRCIMLTSWRPALCVFSWCVLAVPFCSGYFACKEAEHRRALLENDHFPKLLARQQAGVRPFGHCGTPWMFVRLQPRT